MGAGVLPFAVHDERVVFLMQTVFEGRKRGLLNDFGGGSEPGESDVHTAVREFVEETETLYFSQDSATARRTPESVQAQMPVIQKCFENTLALHPDWWCRRLSPDPSRPKDWKTFFIEIPYRDVEPLNRLWELDRSGRYKKRRELHWLSATDLASLYAHHPERLWKRVRQLEGAVERIAEVSDRIGSRSVGVFENAGSQGGDE